MAFDGAGVFRRLYNWVTDAAAGVPIRADKMDAEMDGFATGLTNCITRDGQGKPSAAIDWNGQDLTGVADFSAGTVSVTDTTVPSGNAMYKAATSTLGFAAGGVEYARLNSSGLSVGTGDQTNATGDGTVRAPTAIGTNLAGAALYLKGGIGTGSGLGGSIIFQTAPAGLAGTTQGTPTTALTLDSTQLASFAGAVNIAGNVAVNTNKFTVAAGSGNGGFAGTLGVGGATVSRVLDVLGQTTANTANQVRIKAYQAAFEVMNNAASQNWYFGVDDGDSNKLKIGRGYSAGQGIGAALAFDTSDNATFAGTITSAAKAATRSATGGETLTSGLILKWGSTAIAGSGSASGSTSVTFGAAFPNGVLQVLICGQSAAVPAQAYFGSSSDTASGFSLTWSCSAGQMSGGTTVKWLAIGY